MSGCHVVLCGWLRAQPRHVRKIASWYEDHGHSVTELLTPADGVLPSRMRHHAACALEEVREHAGARRPLLFHCFSGHGAILHALMVSQIHVTAPAEANAAAAQKAVAKKTAGRWGRGRRRRWLPRASLGDEQELPRVQSYACAANHDSTSEQYRRKRHGLPRADLLRRGRLGPRVGRRIPSGDEPSFAIFPPARRLRPA